MLRHCFALTLSLLLVAGCDDSLFVFVDVVSDHVVGEDFDAVETTLVASESGASLGTITRSVDATASFEFGARVAEFSGISSGAYAVEVRLMREGAEVARRRVTFAASSSYAVTVPFRTSVEPCVVRPEMCNGVDDDCDELIDEDDPGAMCPLAGAAAVACESGACQVVGCADDLLDCDEDPATGCEVDARTDDAHCGGCAMTCAESMVCEQQVCRGLGAYVEDTEDLPGYSTEYSPPLTETIPFHEGGFLLSVHSQYGSEVRLTAVDASLRVLWTRTISGVSSGVPVEARGIHIDGADTTQVLVHLGEGREGDVFVEDGPTLAVGTDEARDILVTYGPLGDFVRQEELPFSPVVITARAVPPESQFIGVDADGNRAFYVMAESDIDLGDGPVTVGRKSAFLASFDSDFALRWVRHIDISGSTYGFLRAGEVNSSGAILLRTTSLWPGTIDFGAGPIIVTSNMSAAMLFDADGSLAWVTRYRGNLLAAKLTEAGAAVVMVSGPPQMVATYWYIERLTPLGEVEGAFDLPPLRFPGSGPATSAGRMSIGPRGDIYIAGKLGTPVDFGGGRRAPLFDAVYLASYGPDGAYRFDHYWSEGASSGYATLSVTQDQILVGGIFTGSIDFGGGSRMGSDSPFLVLLRD
ncbi:MAG: hypothetical protein DRJ42_30005 [Deltaproteobacteria bacterium]|nr:MAG: hypothetical protein DRJ42_30005 [Deltaproteobacteria bacterium]